MMSITLKMNSNMIEGSGFVHVMSCIPIFESPGSGKQMIGNLAGGGKFPVNNLGVRGIKKIEEREKEDEVEFDSSSSSSSIGRNSDISNEDDFDEIEVQSSYKESFDTMDSLEESLPIKRGISKFYRGKSKSFTSLADASSSSSVKDIIKPENAYSRRRRNLLACGTILDKNKHCYPLRRSSGGGISKRMTYTRSKLALAVVMSNSETDNSYNSEYPGSPPATTVSASSSTLVTYT